MQRRQTDGDPNPNTPAITFNVEIGPNSNPLMRVRIRDKDFPLELSASQASQLGRALLAISAVCNNASPPPEGTRIENCHFPVVKWATGHSNSNGLPILLVEVPGGAELILQFDPQTAQVCGASLAGTAAKKHEPAQPT